MSKAQIFNCLLLPSLNLSVCDLTQGLSLSITKKMTSKTLMQYSSPATMIGKGPISCLCPVYWAGVEGIVLSNDYATHQNIDLKKRSPDPGP